MADSKISALASGAPAQAGDEYVVARAGANYKLTLTNIAASMPPIGATTPNTGAFTSLTNGLGAVGTPSYTFTGDLNTGMWSPTADTVAWSTGGSERMRLDTSGNLLVGTSGQIARLGVVNPTGGYGFAMQGQATDGQSILSSMDRSGTVYTGNITFPEDGSILFGRLNTGSQTTRMTIDSSGNVGIGTTSTNPIGDNTVGTVIFGSGAIAITRDSNPPLLVNRKTNDGNLVEFYQDGVLEGSISVAGNVVSYNPFMGSHYTEIVGAMPTLKGTVLESLDELVDGKYSSQDRLPKAKVSDTAGSSSVYGVYFSPDSNPDTNNGILAAALGASWVRIAAGVTVQRGDLLESNGDGCAKVQSDDIIRSKTIGKVTSTTVADTYPDGSYIVPCVLYCG